ncbi:MAG: patatin-like phospholipase family protein [Phycisphaerales bacterium]
MARSQFRNLVFEGGGVLGIAYAGALRELQKRGVLQDIERVAGASAGAITACLLAIGYSADEIEDVVGRTSFESFMDAPGGFFVSLARSISSFGWYRGDAFSQWLRERFIQKGLSPDLTFIELEAMAESPENTRSTQPGKFRKLYVVASDITQGVVRQYDANEERQRNELLAGEGRESEPMPIWRAVRASMSIPFFFSSVREAISELAGAATQGAWQRRSSARVLVDGGVTWNYPIDLFDDKRFIDEADSIDRVTADPKNDLHFATVYDEGHVYNKQTLGFRVDTADEVAEYMGREQSPRKPITSVLGYCLSLIQFMRAIALKSHLKTHDWHRTVFLDAGTISFTKFDLTRDEIETLVRSGEAGCRKYFDWFDKDVRAADDERPINKVIPAPALAVETPSARRATTTT